MTADLRRSAAHVPTGQFWELTAENARRESSSSSWAVGAQNFVVQLIHAHESTELSHVARPHEQLLVLATSTSSASIVSDSGRIEVSGRTVVVLPPGDSRVQLGAGSQALRLVGRDDGDVADTVLNRGHESLADERVRPVVPWPLRTGESSLRAYALDEVAPNPDRLGRIFQCSIGMVNVFYPEDEPRDDTALTPHTHEDFEQCTVQLSGDYVHRIRIPWTPQLADWRPDEHRMLSSPAMTLIPARAVHTSQGVHPGRHQLIDVFSPPRLDWARRPGWVLNGDEYQAPPELAADVTA